jgi:hypothetical protein
MCKFYTLPARSITIYTLSSLTRLELAKQEDFGKGLMINDTQDEFCIIRLSRLSLHNSYAFVHNLVQLMKRQVMYVV